MSRSAPYVHPRPWRVVVPGQRVATYTSRLNAEEYARYHGWPYVPGVAIEHVPDRPPTKGQRRHSRT